MSETRRRFDPEFREGAVRSERPVSRLPRSLGTWGSTRALWPTGLPGIAGNMKECRGFRLGTSPS
jgi:hypothetical protein